MASVALSPFPGVTMTAQRPAADRVHQGVDQRRRETHR